LKRINNFNSVNSDLKKYQRLRCNSGHLHHEHILWRSWSLPA